MRMAHLMAGDAANPLHGAPDPAILQGVLDRISCHPLSRGTAADGALVRGVLRSALRRLAAGHPALLSDASELEPLRPPAPPLGTAEKLQHPAALVRCARTARFHGCC
jgi:hypothetical protein